MVDDFIGFVLASIIVGIIIIHYGNPYSPSSISGKAELTPFPPTPFIIMWAPRNHTNIPLICLVVFPILAVSGRCVHTAMFKVVGPEDGIFPVSLADPLHHKGS